MLWVWILIRGRCTTLCDNVCQWLATGWWFSPGPQVSSTNKTNRQDMTEILLKVALNKQTKYITYSLSILQIKMESYLFTNINTHSLSLYGYNSKSKVQIEGPVIENLWSFIKSFNNGNIYNCDVIYILLLAQEINP